MNEIKEKITKVKMGLFLCNEPGISGSCDYCPYNGSFDCEHALYADIMGVLRMIDSPVIDSLSDSHNEKTQRKMSENTGRFITLTRWIDSRTIAVNVDAIRYIEDASTHTESTIYFKEAREPIDESILVKETIIDILEKISEGKSE